MYKLHICLRYLRSRVIAYFAMAGVALCVAMLLIVVSVMTGFLNKIEDAARGLFGELIVDPGSSAGLAGYDEFARVLKANVPEVEATSPFIIAYGMLRLPERSSFRQPVTIAGIRLPERAEVSDFDKGLFVQAHAAKPTFTPSMEQILETLSRNKNDMLAIKNRLQAEADAGQLSPSDKEILDFLRYMVIRDNDRNIAKIQNADLYRRLLLDLQNQLDQAELDDLDHDEVIKPLQNEIRLLKPYIFEGPENRVILGQGIPGLSLRTGQGETIRLLLPGGNVWLYVFPLGRQISIAGLKPNMEAFTVIDDCKTDVSSIDSQFVYVPFERLQKLNNMAADPQNPFPRCSQLHIKVREPYASDYAKLLAVRKKVSDEWAKFLNENEQFVMSISPVEVVTWRERQATLLSQIAGQRALSMIVVGVVSVVSIVLIFVLFYMIVIQKIKDIGILKAIGASGWGIAAIFLGYGAAVGVVGSVLGNIMGYYFVRYINPIHDAVGRWFGLQVWRKDWFLFEQIPNEVEPSHMVAIVILAVAAGLLGALIPAIRAARMQPVEALRYE